ncbi:hypothetical protein B0O99DRAFT_726540 [Bisporella sp. PMI_857]|nr:hypothetical protein B0O99DRAFT_726540 [Bisporella sp. PMI_857]
MKALMAPPAALKIIRGAKEKTITEYYSRKKGRRWLKDPRKEGNRKEFEAWLERNRAKADDKKAVNPEKGLEQKVNTEAADETNTLGTAKVLGQEVSTKNVAKALDLVAIVDEAILPTGDIRVRDSALNPGELKVVPQAEEETAQFNIKMLNTKNAAWNLEPLKNGHNLDGPPPDVVTENERKKRGRKARRMSVQFANKVKMASIGRTITTAALKRGKGQETH